MPRSAVSPVWSCRVCQEQFFGGLRCNLHNPTPEERFWHPVLAALDRLDPQDCTPMMWAWLIEECGVLLGQSEYAAEYAAALCVPARQPASMPAAATEDYAF